ncbi:MAG TPA: tRNA (guanosine(37)-N1)-methyltransferase TrmD [Pyrinomonadaceae bacterium]|nr:tRNA (guanosine(37)-N1)-methyltransferase TrmD [Chloracidobacterium sp.]MBP9934240.1 tRNA (guanosine(37)-N1)-methyltransferase TrmD [Pyrinomonadaceae bacterium]MBK7801564.1 tRNA (guanosine(37)-N1)-methyltransferase TrmD [Chloracidobacterium sp.]MBK9436880.1 tRNA (guanosine(37)-N1)-methyltransferase TrmD [Chloracidobacterium sp.]MBL0241873.1 tRNA (guanosine(37)-N1)-methyltransferase TrmD [Chloracidobacterium sp.]
MKIDVLTIFPEFFGQAFDFGIIRRAKLAGIVEINVHDIREYAVDKHKMVDDRPFGGGDGMVLKPEPIFAAIENLIGTSDRDAYPEGTRVVMLSPQGRQLKQAVAKEFADAAEHIVMICGRYEGVDERVNDLLVTDELSIGDYVLSGGEPAAIVIADSIVRLLPGALGSDTSAANDSFSDGLLDCPHYTRPAEFRGMSVPEVLLNGNHAEIEKWRRAKALEKTRLNRIDLLTGENGDM